jgi:hypothetical protein
MKVTSYAVARPAYYDRNATSTLAVYAADTAPHGSTTRFTTTVAANTKLIVEVMECLLLTTSAPTIAARGNSVLVVTSGATSVDFGRVDQIQNATVSASTTQVYSLAVTVYAAETVTGVTSNGSTGGTLFHIVGYKGTTYAA